MAFNLEFHAERISASAFSHVGRRSVYEASRLFTDMLIYWILNGSLRVQK